MSRFPEGTAIAAKLFYLRPSDAAKNSRRLPDLGATHFSNPGSVESVIVGADGTYLLAESAMDWDRHIEAFSAGNRTAAA